MKDCLFCDKSLKGYSNKFCNNKCQSEYQFQEYIKSWKQGDRTGLRGISTRNISKYIVRYLFDKYQYECARCKWNIKNTYTNKVPLEVEHIDGNSENNDEDNLILLCPNCHSLTNTYRGLNKGHGRLWRREKYVKIV